MKKFRHICLIAMIANFAIQTYFFEQRTADKQMLSLALLLAVLLLMFMAFVCGIFLFSRERFHAFVPMLICLVGFPVSIVAAVGLAGLIKDWRFQKNIPRYNQVVQLVEKGQLKPEASSGRITLPEQYADLAWAVFPKTNHGGLFIEFLDESGFPVKHSGYLYVSTGKIEEGDSMVHHWPFRSRINTNWFQISD